MPDNIDQIITHEEQLEGGTTVTNNPADAGGRTQYGISERANPQAWADGKVTEEEARAIYRQKYVVQPGLDHITDPKLQAQLVDIAVTAGPSVAISKLQTVLGIHADGVLGPQTLAVLATKDPRAVNNALVVARIMMICRIVQAKPSQLQFLAGWADRTCQFIV